MSETKSSYFFEPRGKTALCRKPISVLLPPELDEQVRSLPNKAVWLREAIAEKLEREQNQQTM